MRRNSHTTLLAASLLLGLVASPAALAQDDWDSDDDFSFEGEEDPVDDSERLDEADDLDSVDDTGDDSLEDFADPDDENGDLLGDEEDLSGMDSGDSPGVYRDTQDSVKNAAADEEYAVWEQYLTDYPNTPFRERIVKRMAELEAELYSGAILDDSGPADAMRQEINFSQALLLENIDPRTRFQVGVEWGLPSYINLFLDYEHQLARNFSFHIGARRRYTGYSVEPGVHWALVKSTRTNTLVTVIGDLHVNTIPSWLGVRPQLALGQRFGDTIDFQIQGGPDLELRALDAGMPVRMVGGLSLTYAASETVKVFLESAWNMRVLSANNESYFFRYNTATFGMKFFPKKDRRTNQTSDDVEVNMGATVPYSYNYWSYHFGSVTAQANMYL